MQIIIRLKKKTIAITAILAMAFVAVVMLAWRFMPATARQMRLSSVVVDRASWYEICVSGKPMLYFRKSQGDTLLLGITSCRDSAVHHHRMSGCWTSGHALFPSCEGRVACVDGTMPRELKTERGESQLALIRRSVDGELKVLSYQKSELDYYMRVHGVQDNGYQQIAALASKVDKAFAEATAARHILDSLSRHGVNDVAICLRSQYTAHYIADDKLRSTPLCLLRTDATHRLLLLQTPTKSTPDGVSAVVMLPWSSTAHGDVLCVGYGGIGEEGLDVAATVPAISPAHMSKNGRHDIPCVVAGDGAQVYSKKGTFVGLVCGDSIMPREVVRRLFK